MLYKHVTTVGLALALLGLASTGVFAQSDSGGPVATGVVATITVLDAKTGMATLQTEAGEVFELPKGWHWQVGDQVECDRIDNGPRLTRLQHCQPWQVHTAGAASTRTPATRTGSRGASAPEAAGAADEVRFLATPGTAQPEAGAAPASRRALDGPVEMTCTQKQESFSPRSSPHGGHVVDTTCIAAKGPDGHEVAVRVHDSWVGEKLHCAEQEGKITCPDVRIPAFEPATSATR